MMAVVVVANDTIEYKWKSFASISNFVTLKKRRKNSKTWKFLFYKKSEEKIDSVLITFSNRIAQSW